MPYKIAFLVPLRALHGPLGVCKLLTQIGNLAFQTGAARHGSTHLLF